MPELPEREPIDLGNDLVGARVVHVEHMGLGGFSWLIRFDTGETLYFDDPALYAPRDEEREKVYVNTPHCACGKPLDKNGGHDGGYGAWCG